jgi:tetratricopeptide (TPR) repeat protein
VNALKSSFLTHQAFEDLVGRAVAKVLASESLDDFLDWFWNELFRASASAEQPLDAAGAHALGTMLGRSIWGATPAPHNDFRPRALPEPGRNEPCICGSGRKYKRCCGGGPRPAALRPEDLWPIVLEVLPPAGRKAALDSGRVPLAGLLQLAGQAIDDGRPKFAIGLLEPLFTGQFAGVDDLHDHALNMLCNTYDDLGRQGKKLALLERVRSEAPRSPLRSGACQRLAAMAIDRGDSARAWAEFRQAQRDDPGAPSVGLLEIQLLMAEGRADEARESARVWRRRLQRIGDPELDNTIALLSEIVNDPHAAMADFMIGVSEGAGRRLHEAVHELTGRPLPLYRVVPEAEIEPQAPSPQSIAARLRGMGLPQDQIDALTSDLLARLENTEPDEPAGEAGLEDGVPDRDDGYQLVPPPNLATLEADWHAIYPVDKPFSVHLAPYADEDPWEPAIEDRWMGFLQRHPEAFDSIDILDDLASAIEIHPAGDMLGVGVSLRQPLVERAERILRKALDAADAPEELRLPWLDPVNRPALRCVFRASMLAAEHGDRARERELSELLLRLNPDDNHGVRSHLMNLLLRLGDDEAALALAARFGDDLFPELQYGQVLALVRLGREGEAAEAALRAVNALPEVRRYLMRERAAQPPLDPMGVTLGGKDQAWLYRDAMRDLWLRHPEALALVRKTRPVAKKRAR